jgi:hypothetical protein
MAVPFGTEAEMKVYHFTNTVRLPWIIHSGGLQPSNNRIGGAPPDFLWATTSDSGDRTSSSFLGNDKARLSRGPGANHPLPLDGADFAPWREAAAANPEWTAAHVAGLEQTAVCEGGRNIARWHCRPTPLPLTRAIQVHAKSYSGGRWLQIEATPEYCVVGPSGMRGFVIGNQAYLATRRASTDGRGVYGILRHVDADLARQLIGQEEGA